MSNTRRLVGLKCRVPALIAWARDRSTSCSFLPLSTMADHTSCCMALYTKEEHWWSILYTWSDAFKNIGSNQDLSAASARQVLEQVQPLKAQFCHSDTRLVRGWTSNRERFSWWPDHAVDKGNSLMILASHDTKAKWSTADQTTVKRSQIWYRRKHCGSYRIGARTEARW